MSYYRFRYRESLFHYYESLFHYRESRFHFSLFSFTLLRNRFSQSSEITFHDLLKSLFTILRNTQHYSDSSFTPLFIVSRLFPLFILLLQQRVYNKHTCYFSTIFPFSAFMAIVRL